MWQWESELRILGLKRKSERYWQCERRFGLPAWGHLSLFPWSEQVVPGLGQQMLVELDTFHVTFAIEGEHLHFYYHERAENAWEPGGHTSTREIRRLKHNPRTLCEMADEIAALFVEALGGTLRARR